MFSVQIKDLLLFFSLGLRGKELQEVEGSCFKGFGQGRIYELNASERQELLYLIAFSLQE